MSVMHDDAASVRSRAALSDLLASWTTIPAFLCDRFFTVLASNDAAAALSQGFTEGTNLARFAFLEPDVDRGHANWHEASAQMAALLRESLDEHEPDSAVDTIVGELSVHSRDFSVAWADESRRATSRGIVPFDDSPVGRITCSYYMLTVPESDDDVLFIWQPVDEVSRSRLDELIERRRTSESN